MTAANGAFAGNRIGIVGKGGSGKSTVTVLLAKALQDRGYQVCVLDADSTNTGIHQALGFEQPPASLLDYFGGAEFSGGSVSCPVDDPRPLDGAEISLKELDGRYYRQDSQGLFLLQLGKLGNRGPGAGCDGPISKITRDLRVNGLGEHSVTLVDVKAGLEDSARGVVTGLDWLITVVDTNTAALQIAEDMKDLVQRIKAGELPATNHLENDELVKEANRAFREARVTSTFVLLNKIQNEEVESYVKENLEERGIKPIGTIYNNSSISRSWLQGEALDKEAVEADISPAIKRLERSVQR